MRQKTPLTRLFFFVCIYIYAVIISRLAETRPIKMTITVRHPSGSLVTARHGGGWTAE